jgi:predicted nuclease of predicted toxin-antitoxin system
LRRAFDDARILVTRDKDFGELIFRDHQPHCGVIRLSGEMTYVEQALRVMHILSDHVSDLEQCSIITVKTDRVRVTQGHIRH